MKRIIFYAAAVGIFVSSVLAKPAHGAMRVFVGSSRECVDISGLLPELMGGGGDMPGAEWFPGQGLGSDQKPEPQIPETQAPGTEWFPGQGPETSQKPEIQIPETQAPGTEWFPGQGPETSQKPEIQIPETQAPGTEWFPGQGPETSQKPEIQIPEMQAPGTEWFPGQGPETSQKPEIQIPETQAPETEWLPGQKPDGNQNGNSRPEEGGQGGGSGQNDSSGLASYITRIVELVNIQRSAAGLSPVTASAVLSSAADVRAQEIVSKFDHYRPNGTYFNTVLDQRGIAYNGAGENIAYGYDTPERVMTEWMNSASHRANILDGRYTKLGVGYYEQGGVKYWTQLFIR